MIATSSITGLRLLLSAGKHPSHAIFDNMPTIPAALSSPEVPTPALIVDAALLTANIEQMAARHDPPGQACGRT